MINQKRIDEYTDFLRDFLSSEASLKIVCDFSNGSTGPVAKTLFEKTSIDMVAISDKPDGDFPDHGPNPLAPGATDAICQEVVSQKADLGAIFDSDGDRIIFIGHDGRVIDAYEIFSFLKQNFDPPYVADVRALIKFSMPGDDTVESAAGRRSVWQKMKESGASLGVERSGHYFFKDFFSSDSGLFALIQVINMAAEALASGGTLVEALPKSSVFRLPEINIEGTNWAESKEVLERHYADRGFDIDRLDGLTVTATDFAFNIRPSATESVIRINLAAQTKDLALKQLAELKKLIN